MNNQKLDQSYHVSRIVQEFVQAQLKLKDVPPAVSIFGSARTPLDNEMYQKSEILARMLSDHGFSVISGGGPGIMEAANKGAKAGESLSIGLNIALPHEQKPNDYQDVSVMFEHFFSRKMMFILHSVAHVVMPGGFGTLDEFTEVLTLVQTHKIPPVPIILCGSEFWGGLMDWIRQVLLSQKMISPNDLDLIQIIDEPEEIVKIICQHGQNLCAAGDILCNERFFKL